LALAAAGCLTGTDGHGANGLVNDNIEKRKGFVMSRDCMKLAVCLVAVAGVAGCTGGEDESPPGPAGGLPTAVTPVATEGFRSPLDAVASPDGSVFYFTAFTDEAESQAGIFSVPAAGGTATALYTGAPLALPTGLVISCDGSTLVVADAAISGTGEGDDTGPDVGALYTISTTGGTLTPLTADEIAVPTGLALSFDCEQLYVTGWTDEREPTLFRMPIAGGAVDVVYQGAPLVSPTGLYVDTNEVAWVLDHIAGEDGEGVLFAISPDGGIQEVASGLTLGSPGGCSLDSAAGTAFIPVRDERGPARLHSIELATGTVVDIDTPDLVDPAGLRTARNAAVFALVDQEGNAIYRVE
jgi:hypothetical protein